MKLRTLDDLTNVAEKRVLVRVDYNVPVVKNKVRSTDDARLRASLPTLKYLIEHKAQVILVSHLGRPTGSDRKNSLKPVADRLSKLLRRQVVFVRAALDDGKKVEHALDKLQVGQVALLENIRFHSGEEKNDKFLARRLSGLADVFVNDAFATAHRRHASNVGVASLLPSYAGRLMESEIHNLDRLLRKPIKPFIVLMGGAKISGKLPTLQSLLKVADEICVGGGLANSFFRAHGFNTGKSVVSRDDVIKARKLMRHKKIILPQDVVAATSMTAKAGARICQPTEVSDNEYILDIGPRTILDYATRIKRAQTIAWNGPMGLFEIKKFSHGTIALGRIIAARSSGRAFGLVGGGETILALEQTKMAGCVDHVSTGGGAMLEYLTGKTLPGIKPLLK
ncbi:phosphoglycerate kinase [Patescibacteria group bacterium]|nr:phosphoglycerate kinase [Patescibacteria group bacterium]MBU1029403.1 phosphoglycerate kinase [Patescibacteria group bacterium]MBU1916282.1 phosphoglycerate kinase [Patescibacteria group bacterium]